MKEVCGNCKYNKWFSDGFYCDNEDSLEYGSPTAFDDRCEDYEEKEI